MSETQWLDDAEQRAWRQLASLFQRLPAALDTQLQHDADLTHFAYFVLAMLSEAPNRSLRMSQLAAQSSSSPSRLSHTVSRLESRGWVTRFRSEDDGRGQVAQLTDQGLEKVEETAPGHVEAVRSLVFAGLNSEQVGQLETIAAAILGRVDAPASTV